MWRAKHRRAAIAAFACVLSTTTGCGRIADNAAQSFDPNRDGILTVATDLPAPGFWEGGGDDGIEVDALDGGFEWAIAEALADRFDLDLEVIDVAFESIIAGDLDGADLALSQVTITDERLQDVDFSVPYFATGIGILGRADADTITDLKSARELTWVVERGTTSEAFLDDVIRPDSEPLVVDDDSQAATDAVSDGSVDVALLDLATVLVLDDRDDLATLGRFAVDQSYGIVVPPDSDNLEAIDAAVRGLISDHSIDDFADRWLEPIFGPIADIPLIQT